MQHVAVFDDVGFTLGTNEALFEINALITPAVIAILPSRLQFNRGHVNNTLVHTDHHIAILNVDLQFH
jgi:hypothetical protein